MTQSSDRKLRAFGAILAGLVDLSHCGLCERSITDADIRFVLEGGEPLCAECFVDSGIAAALWIVGRFFLLRSSDYEKRAQAFALLLDIADLHMKLPATVGGYDEPPERD